MLIDHYQSWVQVSIVLPKQQQLTQIFHSQTDTVASTILSDLMEHLRVLWMVPVPELGSRPSDFGLFMSF